MVAGLDDAAIAGQFLSLVPLLRDLVDKLVGAFKRFYTIEPFFVELCLRAILCADAGEQLALLLRSTGLDNKTRYRIELVLKNIEKSILKTSEKVARVKDPRNVFGFRTRAAFGRKWRKIGTELQDLNVRLSHVTDVVQCAATRQTFDALLFNTGLQVDIEQRITKTISEQHDEFMQMMQKLEKKIDAIETLVRQDVSGPPPPYEMAGTRILAEKGDTGQSGTQEVGPWTMALVNAVGIGAVIWGVRWLRGV